MERLLRMALERLIRTGNLRVTTAAGSIFTLGDGTGRLAAIRFATRKVERRILIDPELRFGEAYMDGGIIVEQGSIADVLAIVLGRKHYGRPPLWARPQWLIRYLYRRLQQFNPRPRARRNVAQKRHLAAKLLVGPDCHVLDIGCGWGGLALYVAELCHARVTGITLSSEQHAFAQARAAEKELSDKVEFRLQDYRDVSDKFDRIVSVGMFEHVGVGFYDTFFRKCYGLLADDGVMLLHSIGRSDGPNVTNPWIAKYIFPGGYIPALSEVLPAVERAGLLVTDIEILRLHYAETLKAWRERFLAHREEVERLYDPRFVRMWEYYLALSEVGFRTGLAQDYQLILERGRGVGRS